MWNFPQHHQIKSGEKGSYLELGALLHPGLRTRLKRNQQKTSEEARVKSSSLGLQPDLLEALEQPQVEKEDRRVEVEDQQVGVKDRRAGEADHQPEDSHQLVVGGQPSRLVEVHQVVATVLPLVWTVHLVEGTVRLVVATVLPLVGTGHLVEGAVHLVVGTVHLVVEVVLQ